MVCIYVFQVVATDFLMRTTDSLVDLSDTIPFEEFEEVANSLIAIVGNLFQVRNTPRITQACTLRKVWNVPLKFQTTT